MKSKTFGLMLVVINATVQPLRGDDFAAAAGFFQAEQWRAAVEAFDRIQAESPAHPRIADIDFYTAEALLQLGDFALAAARFERFLQAHPHHQLFARAMFRQGECAYFANKPIAAARRLSEFRNRYPDHDLGGFAAVYLANIDLDARNLTDAETGYQAVLRSTPSGTAAGLAHLGLVKVAFQKQQPARMQQHLAILREQFDGLVHHASDWHYWRGHAHLMKDEIREGVAELDRVIQFDADALLVRSALFRAGEALVREGRVDEGVERYQTVVDRRPDSETAERALLNLAQLEIDRNDYSAATRYLDQFRGRYPNSSRLRRVSQMVGVMHLKRHEFRAAINAFEALSHPSVTANRSRTERALTWYYLAHAYYGDGRTKQALEVLNRIRPDLIGPSLASRVLYAQAVLQMEFGEGQRALDVLERAREIVGHTESEIRVNWKRVDVLRSLGRFAEAVGELEKWQPNRRAADPYYRQAARSVAEDAYEAGRYDVALRAYSVILSRARNTADRADAQSGAAWCHLRLGDDLQAAERLSQFVDQYPQDARVPNALMAIASIREKRGEFSRAADVYRQVTAMPLAEAQRWQALLRLSQLLRELDRHEEAVDVLKSSQRLIEDASTRDRVRYELAWALRDAGQPDEANAQFEHIHQSGSHSRYWSDATYRLALAAFEARRFDDARAHVDELMEHFDQVPGQALRPYALYLKARLAAQQQDWKGVILPLDEILGETSSLQLAPAALLLSAEALHRLDDRANARHRLESVRDFRPPLEDRHLAEATMRLAQIQFDEAEWSAALETVGQLARDDEHGPRRAEAQLLAGRSMERLGRTNEAIDSLKQAIESVGGDLNATGISARMALGNLYLQQRKYQLALPYFSQVAAQSSHRAAGMATLQAGKCYERLGEPDEAARLYRRLKELGSRTNYYADAVQRLRILESENPLRPREQPSQQPVSSPIR